MVVALDLPLALHRHYVAATARAALQAFRDLKVHLRPVVALVGHCADMTHFGLPTATALVHLPVRVVSEYLLAVK